MHRMDTELLGAWLSARSIARGLPLPVLEHGGWRVDTCLPDELRRHVFARPDQAISTLASTISSPHILLKLCGTGEQLLRLLPPRWQLLQNRFFMTHEGALAVPGLPAGYRLDVVTADAITEAHIRAEDGSIAASGHAVEVGGVFVFDRIATAPAHQRRGLGRAIMAALAARQASGSARRVLVATEDGLELYKSLDWCVLSPYSTAAMAC